MLIESDKEIHELIAFYSLESRCLHVEHNEKYGNINYVNNERGQNGNENELDDGHSNYIAMMIMMNMDQMLMMRKLLRLKRKTTRFMRKSLQI